MSNTHKGEILEIRKQRQITETFVKRDFVVDQVFVGSYGTTHNPVVFTLVQEKCGMIDQFKVGDHVVVSFDLESRPWIKDKVHQLDRDGELAYFLSAKAWKIEPVVAENTEPQTQAATTEDPTTAPTQTDAMQPNQSFDQTPPSSGATGQGEVGPDGLPF